MFTFNEIKENTDIKNLIKASDETLKQIGFTEHNLAHVSYVSTTAANLLYNLGYDEDIVELTKIAGYLHDIGNSVNRELHPIVGGIMAQNILVDLGMPINDAVKVSFAIGNHDESSGMPLDPISAAIVLADKSDVRRSRVREYDITKFDIHNRVNYSVLNSHLKLNIEDKVIKLVINLDTRYSTALDYYEIFLSRMTFCKTAAKTLGCTFELIIEEIS